MRALAQRPTMAARLLARLAVALPASLRRQYGAELLATLDDELDRERASGGLTQALVYSLRAAIDLLVTGFRERARQAWLVRRRRRPKARPRFLGGLGYDLLAAARSLRRRPGPAVATIGVLSVGVSAVVAVFTYVNAFSQAPPGADASRLVQILGVTESDPSQPISFLDFLDYADGTTDSFDALAAVQSSSAASVRHETTTDVAMVEAVSGRFFETFGLATAVGRPLRLEDDRPGAEPVVVISFRWWREAFRADPTALGQTVFLNNRPHTLVGVMAPDFLGALASFRPDVWVPFEPYRARYTGWDAQAKIRERPLVRVFGRVRPGIDADSALDDLHRTAAGLDAQYPQDGARRLRVATATWIDPAARADESQTVRLMSLAAIGLALLVAANVANLLLASATGRRQEFAMRVALGASRGRLLRQALLEHTLLSAVSGGVAMLAAGPLSARLGSYFARPGVWGNAVARETAADLHVWLFALGCALAMGLLTGWVPAWRASRERFSAVTNRAPAAVGGWTRRRWPDMRGTLVAAQVALAVALVVVAGLVLRTLNLASSLDPGFDYQRTIGSYVSTSSTTVPADERVAFYRDLSDRLTDEPWVRAATVADAAPLSPHASAQLRADGQTEAVPVATALVLPRYFETLGIAVTRGRNLSIVDDDAAPAVVLLNEAAVVRLFPDTEPLGRRIWRPDTSGEREYEVVGVVGDAKVQDFLAPPEPVVYLSAPQHPHSTTGALIVATVGDPAAEVAKLERWLRDYESHLAIVNALPYSDVVRGVVYVQRMNAELFSALAGLGLMLSAIGVFSVMALMVAHRTREIGIRMAVGARASTISRMVIVDALVPIALGLVAGAMVSLAAVGLIRSLLFGVEPTDPLATAGGLAVVLIAVVSAAYVPARRAARVDPVRALRC